MKKFSLGCLGFIVLCSLLSLISKDFAVSFLAAFLVLGTIALIPWFFFRKRLDGKNWYFWGVVALLCIPLALSIKDTPKTSPDDANDGQEITGNAVPGANESRVTVDSSRQKPQKNDSIPALIGPLCDYAGIFSKEEARQLKTRLASFETADEPAQFVVLTIEKLPAGSTKESFCQEVGTAWALGDKDKDNGLLFLFSLKDRTCQLATGYGLEGTLPDSVCGTICRSAVPDFKNENYAAGILRIVDEVDRRLNRERYFADARAKHATLFNGFPGSDGFWDPSGYFSEKQAARLRELLAQEWSNTKRPLHLICIQELYGINISEVCRPAWEKLHRTDPAAVLLCVSLRKDADEWKHVFTPDSYECPESFNITVKYMCTNAQNTADNNYKSIARAILDFEQEQTGHRPKGWWEFNLVYGIVIIIMWILGIGLVGFIGLIIWAIIDEFIHPGKSTSSGGSYHSSSSYSSSSYSSSSRSSSYSGRGGSFGGGGGGASW